MKTLYYNSERDVYILPSQKNGLCIFYSPLRDSSFVFSSDLIEDVSNYYSYNIKPNNSILNAYLSDIDNKRYDITPVFKEIDTEDRAVIILTQKCNLSCSYCFAQSSRSTSVLSNEKIEAVVDYIFQFNNNKPKVFSFIGGGEPLICWHSIQHAYDYIKKKSLCTNIPFRFGIITNATLLDENKIRWIAQRSIHISVSFDILPDIQDKQRPFSFKKDSSFEKVDNSIKLLLSYGASFKIRATITSQNVKRMSEMVLFVAERYNDIKYLHLEPVTDSKEDYNNFYALYLDNFVEAYVIGMKYGITVINSISNSFYHIKSHFCLGELCVTPSGEIVSCHRHSSPKDINYNSCVYGSVSEGAVNINNSLLNSVILKRRNSHVNCQDCFAKWHCAGGCSSQNMVFSIEQHNLYCNYVRKFIRRFIELKLSEDND